MKTQPLTQLKNIDHTVTTFFKLAKEAGLVELSVSEKDQKFMLANNVLSDEITNELLENYDQVWEDIMENSNSNPNESVGTYADMKFDLLKQK